jgi:integrase
MLRDHEDGLAVAQHGYTVADAVESWLAHGLNGRDPKTISDQTGLAKKHVIPDLGARKLRDLTADEVDEWLARKSAVLSTDTLRRLLSILRRSIRRAQARDRVKRNVAMLCEVPKGTRGRPSKSLTLHEARALLDAAADTPIGAYIVVSLMTGARTEELRALTWNHIDLDGDPSVEPPVPPSMRVWRSVRAGGDTKSKRSRRTLELPRRCVEALRDQRATQTEARTDAGDRWVEHNLVFATSVGTPLDSANVRRSFRAVARSAAGLSADEWTPRELRHSFVSLLSSSGVPIEDISRLVGHVSTSVTEKVYRKELRPVLTKGAAIMDQLFAGTHRPSPSRGTTSNGAGESAEHQPPVSPPAGPSRRLPLAIACESGL